MEASMLFRNYYSCTECGCDWTDIWSAQCDDDYMNCGSRHMSPRKSDDVAESLPTLSEIEDALEGAITDLEAWAIGGPDRMTLAERTRFQRYQRILDRVTGADSCKNQDVEEGGDRCYDSVVTLLRQRSDVPDSSDGGRHG